MNVLQTGKGSRHEGEEMIAPRLPLGLHRILWIFLASLPAPSLAQSRMPQDFAISGDEGQLLGWQQTHAAEDGAATRWSIRRLLAYTVDGHQPMRNQITVTVRVTGDRWESLDYEIASDNRTRKFRIVLNGAAATVEELGRGGSSRTQALDPALPFAQPELLAGLPVGPFQTFDAGRGRIVKREGRFVDLPPQETRKRQLYLMYEDDRPVDGWIVAGDGETDIERAVRPNFSTPLRFALAPAADPPRDPPGNARVRHPMIASPYDIPPDARGGHIRFRFDLPHAVAETLPQTAEQGVEVTDSGARIDVCTDCGPSLSDDPAQLARWTQPTPWLQSDDRVIADAARTARSLGGSDATVMDELARIARRRLEGVDFAGHYSASAAWRRRAGDCTEDAVLLAALARAAGIPALVASGMVYTRERYHQASDAFIPHSWVVAYLDGEWRSVDMTLGALDSTHVALTLGEGDAQSVAGSYFIAGLIEWQDMAEVRPRPSD